MNGPTLHSLDDHDLSLDPSGLARLVAIDLGSSKDVVLLVSPSFGRAVLDDVDSRLGSGRDRVVRVSGAAEDGLSLPQLLRQLAPYGDRLSVTAGRAGPERGIQVLTTLDPSCDRIILLTDAAERLDRGALRAIQLACQATSRLRLVFAGGAQLLTALDHPELSELHGRLRRGVRYAMAVDAPDLSDPMPATLETFVAARPPPARAVIRGALAVACLGLAAVGYWALSSEPALQPETVRSAASPTTPATPGDDSAAPADVAASGKARDPEVKVQPDPATLTAAGLGAAMGPVPETGSAAVAKSKLAAGSAPSRHTPATPVQQPRRGAPSKEQSPSRTGDKPHADLRQAEIATPSQPSGLPPARARSLADSQTGGGYIGTFTTGPGGIRTFRYLP